MGKNLLIFYGELRTLPLIIKEYNLDGFDVIISTWDRCDMHKLPFDSSEYDNLTMVVSRKDPTYLRLQTHENCIIYHCWNAIKDIELNKYDNVILQRTDAHINLDVINLGLIEDDVYYRLFDNTSGHNGLFMNDILMLGKPNIVKEYFEKEHTILPDLTIDTVEPRKFANELARTVDSYVGESVTESVSGIKIKDIYELTGIKDSSSWWKLRR